MGIYATSVHWNNVRTIIELLYLQDMRKLQDILRCTIMSNTIRRDFCLSIPSLSFSYPPGCYDWTESSFNSFQYIPGDTIARESQEQTQWSTSSWYYSIHPHQCVLLLNLYFWASIGDSQSSFILNNYVVFADSRQCTVALNFLGSEVDCAQPAP